MNDSLIGKPSALKQVNLSLVRRAIMEKGSATRAEIVDIVKTSATTVRMLLTQMKDNGELVEMGFDDSIGGRKAVRYKLNENRFYGVAFCLNGDSVRYLTVNIYGEICESGTFNADGDTITAICNFLDELCAKTEIRAIGVGVPGIVNGMGYDRKDANGELKHYAVGGVLSERYNVPVVLENDLNAIATGFLHCYLKTFPEESSENTNMAYIHFDKDCLSAGFISGGRILRGFNNYVGELGLFPMENEQTFDELLASPISDKEYASVVSKMIAAVCCILNPEYVALGGTAFRKECLPLITECFHGTLPGKMSAEILYAEDKWYDYFCGMAHLTAEQIFADVRLVKE